MKCCAYSPDFDRATSRKDSYIDVLIIFAVKAKVIHVSGLAIPIHSSSSGQHIYEIIKRFLKVLLDSKWNSKHFSVAKNVARNMTGIVGAVKRSERELLPVLFRLRCATHQNGQKCFAQILIH